MKERTCKWCKQKFAPMRLKQVCCAPECAEMYAAKVRVKLEKINAAESVKIIRLKRESLKTKSEWAREAQTVFNQYVRLRDHSLPCISCGRHHEGQYHAGHYRTVGSHPELRFEELNVHKQCSVCNNHKSGNIVEYRINLAKKIGLENLEWLEGNHPQAKLTIDDYKRIKETYKAKIKELKNVR